MYNGPTAQWDWQSLAASHPQACSEFTRALELSRSEHSSGQSLHEAPAEDEQEISQTHAWFSHEMVPECTPSMANLRPPLAQSNIQGYVSGNFHAKTPP